MIATNYRKHPEAMALQLVLPFPRLFRWHTSRPTTRIGRAHRAAIAAAFKAAGPIRYPEPAKVPSWVSLAKSVAKRLARTVKAACMALPFDELERLQRQHTGQPLTGYKGHLVRLAMARAASKA